MALDIVPTSEGSGKINGVPPGHVLRPIHGPVPRQQRTSASSSEQPSPSSARRGLGRRPRRARGLHLDEPWPLAKPSECNVMPTASSLPTPVRDHKATTPGSTTGRSMATTAAPKAVGNSVNGIGAGRHDDDDDDDDVLKISNTLPPRMNSRSPMRIEVDALLPLRLFKQGDIAHIEASIKLRSHA